MAWLYVPSRGSHFVPGLEDSSLGSSSPWESDTELSVTSSGTPTQRASSWRGWQTRPWIRLLSGTISNPSTADGSARQWILSLRGSRVSQQAQQESVRATETNAGSGLSLQTFFATRDRELFFWKTCVDSSNADSPRFSDRWPISGSMWSGECSKRPRLERRTSDPGCSFLPTPAASPYGSNRGGGAGRIGKIRLSLRGIFGGPENPEYIEWMMGLPTGWTDCDASGTPWFPSKPRSPSESSGGG